MSLFIVKISFFDDGQELHLFVGVRISIRMQIESMWFISVLNVQKKKIRN